VNCLFGKKKLGYVYGFGDHLQHTIQIGKAVPLPEAQFVSFCVDGQNACPPEDVGGVDGYLNLLSILDNPAHEEHADMISWLGGPFDPTVFDLDKANERLERIKLKRPSAKALADSLKKIALRLS
jgi:Plasmid pRiA4b ORF-3-like protein